MTAEFDASQLIVRIGRDRDRAAFAALFGYFAPRIKSYLMRLGGDARAAEEPPQEPLLTVWRRAETFDPSRGAGSTWIFVIARNCRVDHLRRERLDLVYADTPPDLMDEADDQEKTLSASESGEDVREAMLALPPDQREVVQLSFFEDRPHSEIAARLGLPLGTVKSRLRLAMARLRARLETST